MNRSGMRNRMSLIGLAVAMVAACSTAPSSPDSSSAVPSNAPESSAETRSPQTADAAATVIDVTVAGGVVTPTNATVQATVGQPIVLEVSSDTVDSLHVHSVPEHAFDVAAVPDQRFEFTVNVPGRVAVELHDAHVTVVTIEVRP